MMSCSWIALSLISPRMWGWTGNGIRLAEDYLNLSTHVGVDRSTRPCAAASASISPRMRGGPPAVEEWWVLRKISPRMWRWTEGAPLLNGEATNVPTLAGAEWAKPQRPGCTLQCSHGCGRGLQASAVWLPGSSTSPRMWGWTVATVHWGGPQNAMRSELRRMNVPTHGGVDRHIAGKKFAKGRFLSLHRRAVPVSSSFSAAPAEPPIHGNQENNPEAGIARTSNHDGN
jgi:hypothetical protein